MHQGSAAVQDRVEILLRVGDGLKVVGVHERFDHRFREKGGHRGAETDVFDAEGEQCEQDAHGLLLVPRQHQRERQVVDGAAESFGEGKRDLYGAVRVVALSDVENARDAVDLAKVKVIETELAAGEREDERIHRRALDELI